MCSCASAAALFSRASLAQPAALLPTLTSATTCAAFCPKIFERSAAHAQQHSERASAAPPAATTMAAPVQLPYKLVFAVGSTDSVFVYDTGASSNLVCTAHL